MRSFSSVAALMAVLTLAQFARGADKPSWVGRQVMIKRAEVRPQIGKQPTGDPLRAVFAVKQVQGEWLWVGEGWLRSGDVLPVEEAVAWFDRELQQRPTAFACLGRGVARGEHRDLDGAIADFTAALRIEPRSQRAYTDRAIAFGKKRQMEQALKDLNSAMALGPPSVKLIGTRGVVRWEMRDYRGALDDVNRALRMNPRDADAYSNRSAVHMKLGNLVEALADLEKAIRLEPHNAIFYANRGWVYSLLHRYDEALKDFDEAIRLDPNFVHVRINRGDLWLMRDEYDKAIAEYDEAIRLDRKCDGAWRLRAAAHRHCGDLALAASEVDEAIRIAPKESANYCERARLDKVRGDYRAMLKDATKATELDPRNDDAFQCRASARSHLGDIQGSIADLSRAIELMPSRLSLFQSGQPFRAPRGFGSKIGSRVIARSRDMRLQIGNRRVGEALGETVLIVKRVQGDWLWVGQGWIRTDDVVSVEEAVSEYVRRLSRGKIPSDLKGALADCDAALRLSPDYALLYGLRARFRQLQGDKTGARSDLQKAVELAPDQAAFFLTLLARTSLQRNDDAEAIGLFSRVLETKGASQWQLVMAYIELAEIWAECSDADLRHGRHALHLATKACELTHWKLPGALSALGAAHAECGNYAEAIRWEKAALEVPGESIAVALGDEDFEEWEIPRRSMYEARLDCYRQGKRLYELGAGGGVYGVADQAVEASPIQR